MEVDQKILRQATIELIKHLIGVGRRMAQDNRDSEETLAQHANIVASVTGLWGVHTIGQVLTKAEISEDEIYS